MTRASSNCGFACRTVTQDKCITRAKWRTASEASELTDWYSDGEAKPILSLRTASLAVPAAW